MGLFDHIKGHSPAHEAEAMLDELTRPEPDVKKDAPAAPLVEDKVVEDKGKA